MTSVGLAKVRVGWIKDHLVMHADCTLVNALSVSDRPERGRSPSLSRQAAMRTVLQVRQPLNIALLLLLLANTSKKYQAHRVLRFRSMTSIWLC